jgi:hypothetical protein
VPYSITSYRVTTSLPPYCVMIYIVKIFNALTSTNNQQQDIKDLDIDSLIKFLNKHNNRLQLDDEDFFTLKDNKISGARFLLLKKKRSC